MRIFQKWHTYCAKFTCGREALVTFWKISYSQHLKTRKDMHKRTHTNIYSICALVWECPSSAPCGSIKVWTRYSHTNALAHLPENTTWSNPKVKFPRNASNFKTVQLRHRGTKARCYLRLGRCHSPFATQYVQTSEESTVRRWLSTDAHTRTYKHM